jgi:multiple sugar transport system substrate-binding protein
MMSRIRVGTIVLLTAVAVIGLVLALHFQRERAEERVIRFWHPYTQPQRTEEMLKAAVEFQRANPGVKVEIESVPWANVNERWRAAHAKGELPDVGVGNPPDYLDMWQAGAILPVDDVIAALGGDRRFIPGILDRHTRFQGKTLAVPHYMHALVLLYRKDLLKEKGLEPPATWEDLLRVAVKLTTPPDSYGFQQLWSRKDWIGIPWVLYPLMRSNGGEFFDRDGNVTFNTPENVEAIKYLVQLYKGASSSAAFDLERNKDQIEVLSKGRTALDLGTLYGIPELEQENPAVGNQLVATYPPRKKQVGWFTFANCLVLFKGKNPEDGKRWIQFLLEDEQYSRFLRSIPGAMMPVTNTINQSKDFWEHPFFRKHSDEVRILQEGVAQGSFPGASQGLHANVGLLVESEALPRMLERIIKENANIEKAVAQAQQEFETDLARIKLRREAAANTTRSNP